MPGVCARRVRTDSRSSRWPTPAPRAARRRTPRSRDARIYESHEQMLEAERGRIDFVDVTTPPVRPRARSRGTRSRAGLHVLCEKPLATTARGSRAHGRAGARRCAACSSPATTTSTRPVIKAVRQVLDAGLLGQVQLVTLQTFRNTHAKGVDEWRRDWRRERRYSGGGIAMDHGSHTFYLAFDWLGAYPTAITAKMSTLGEFDTEDNFACAMTFPERDGDGAPLVDRGRAQGHLHDPRRARRGPRRGRRRRGRRDERRRGRRRPRDVGDEEAEGRVGMDGREPRRVVPFAASTSSPTPSRADDFVSHETESSVRCVELITSAYASAPRRLARATAVRRGPSAKIDLALLARASSRASARGGRGLRGPCVARRRGTRTRAIDRAGRSPLLGKGAMEMAYWAHARPSARVCIALGAERERGVVGSLALAGAAGARPCARALRRGRGSQRRLVAGRRARRHGRARDGHRERLGRGARRCRSTVTRSSSSWAASSSTRV